MKYVTKKPPPRHPEPSFNKNISKRGREDLILEEIPRLLPHNHPEEPLNDVFLLDLYRTDVFSFIDSVCPETKVSFNSYHDLH